MAKKYYQNLISLVPKAFYIHENNVNVKIWG